jgi:hypothetical protein
MNNERTLPVPHSYKDMLGHTCRECINRRYKLHLTPIDVVCQDNGGICSYCGMEKPIVSKLTFFGKIIMMFHE